MVSSPLFFEVYGESKIFEVNNPGKMDEFGDISEREKEQQDEREKKRRRAEELLSELDDELTEDSDWLPPAKQKKADNKKMKDARTQKVDPVTGRLINLFQSMNLIWAINNKHRIVR
jgi:hypothetical protein